MKTKLALVLVCVIVLTACKANTEVSDFLPVAAIGVDYKNGEYSVTVLATNYDEKNDLVFCLSAIGPDIGAAIQRINEDVDGELHFKQSSMLVLGSECANNQPELVIGYFQQHLNIYSPVMAVYVCEGAAAPLLSEISIGAKEDIESCLATTGLNPAKLYAVKITEHGAEDFVFKLQYDSVKKKIIIGNVVCFTPGGTIVTDNDLSLGIAVLGGKCDYIISPNAAGGVYIEKISVDIMVDGALVNIYVTGQTTGKNIEAINDYFEATITKAYRFCSKSIEADYFNYYNMLSRRNLSLSLSAAERNEIKYTECRVMCNIISKEE